MTKLDTNKTALVLIDVQKESEFGIKGVKTAVDNTKELISKCRELNIPVIYTRQINRKDTIGLSNGEPLKEDGEPVFYNDGTDAADIVDKIKPENQDIVIDKYRWSSFYETSLDLILKNMGIKHLIIGGFVTDGCLMTTVFDAYFRDYQVNLVKDICGTTNEGAHMSSIMIMANWIYDLAIYDSAELINKLTGKPGKCWKSDKPDQFQFTPENMRQVFEKLNQ